MSRSEYRYSPDSSLVVMYRGHMCMPSGQGLAHPWLWRLSLLGLGLESGLLQLLPAPQLLLRGPISLRPSLSPASLALPRSSTAAGSAQGPMALHTSQGPTALHTSQGPMALHTSQGPMALHTSSELRNRHLMLKTLVQSSYLHAPHPRSKIRLSTSDVSQPCTESCGCYKVAKVSM